MNAASKLLACSLISVISIIATAEVVPYVKDLWPQGQAPSFSSLTIPSGKVVVFDHMRINGSTATIRMYYDNTGSGIDTMSTSAFLVFTNPVDGFVVATPGPIRMRAGWSITNASTVLVTFYGLAMDENDLYAGVNSEINSIGLAGGPLPVTGKAQLESPRPVVASVERSSDLKSWSEDDNAIIQKFDTAQLSFESDNVDPGAFYRLMVRSRSKSSN